MEQEVLRHIIGSSGGSGTPQEIFQIATELQDAQNQLERIRQTYEQGNYKSVTHFMEACGMLKV